MANQFIPKDGLTEDQHKALDGYFNKPGKLFYGTSMKNAIENFHLVNKFRNERNTEKADKHESAWFNILGYSQNGTS